MPIQSVDTNLFEFYAYVSAASGHEIARLEGCSCVDLAPSPWPKAVFDLDFSAAASLPHSLLEGIRGGRLPNKVRVGPTSRPREVERLLAEAGFSPGKGSRGMTLDLESRSRARLPEGLAISPLDGAEDFAAFARIVASNLFGTGIESGPAFAEVLGRLGRDRAFGFLGEAEGAPASTAFAFIDGSGVGGIYFVATEAGSRGKGFGAATVSAALDELASRGAERCILHATELGKPVYERLGFVDACPLAIYSLSV